MLEKLADKVKPQQKPMPVIQAEPEDEHTHQWQAIAKTYAPPRRQLIEGLEGDVLQHALFGVTTVLWECAVCKQLRKAYALGSETPQLDELLDKTELYGTQYFQREGVTYVLQKYVPVQPAQTVPLR